MVIRKPTQKKWWLDYIHCIITTIAGKFWFLWGVSPFFGGISWLSLYPPQVPPKNAKASKTRLGKKNARALLTSHKYVNSRPKNPDPSRICYFEIFWGPKDTPAIQVYSKGPRIPRRFQFLWLRWLEASSDWTRFKDHATKGISMVCWR